MTKPILPSAKPRLSSSDLHEKLSPYDLDRTLHPVIVLVMKCAKQIRGYYLKTMGDPVANNRGIYDDVLFIDSPQVTAVFNANTDPSHFRKGRGSGKEKGIARLKPGLYNAHCLDLHKNKYLALVQRLGEVTVIRDGEPDYEETGYFGVNIHKGGYTTTSSLGCQTIHPDKWDSFISTVKDQSVRYFGKKWDKTVIPYVLMG
ncbi:MAG: hypothetical protein LCH54_17440 [Bacteroidetes bacterium]|nr:hypothetical protein [Bacteroidota bacterium]